MKIIGLTGGIGSGKSTVAREFEKLGVPIYIADERSKNLLSNDTDVIQAVKELLGTAAFTIEGTKEIPDRNFISSQVFTNKNLLQGLNSILHPAVRRDFKNFKQEHVEFDFIIYEAAILFESGGNTMCDEILLVTSNKEERIRRVMVRDGVEKNDVIQRMKNQWSENKKLEGSDLVIYNDNLSSLPVLVNNIHLFMLNNSDIR